MANKRSLNRVLLVGNIGRDPEITDTNGGTTVAKFSLATTDVYKDKDGQFQESTEWHNIVAWGFLAQKCEKMPKGAMVLVEGKLKTRKWEDREGNKRQTTEIIAEAITRLDVQKRDEGDSSEPEADFKE